jgi:hypothetical protein
MARIDPDLLDAPAKFTGPIVKLKGSRQAPAA